MLYITYFKFGVLQRAIVSQQKYDLLLKDGSITNLQIHPNQNGMDNFYKESKGQKVSTKQLLHG